MTFLPSYLLKIDILRTYLTLERCGFELSVLEKYGFELDDYLRDFSK